MIVLDIKICLEQITGVYDATAQDNLDFLVHWLEKFPELKDVDIYLAGESYAGMPLSSLIVYIQAF